MSCVDAFLLVVISEALFTRQKFCQELHHFVSIFGVHLHKNGENGLRNANEPKSEAFQNVMQLSSCKLDKQKKLLLIGNDRVIIM